MTLPIKKRINSELFIDRKPALYILVDPQIEYNVCKVTKDAGMRNQTAACF